MAKYLFIFGRNPDLSQAELVSYLEKENVSVSRVFFSSNSAMLNCDELNLGIVEDLGGTIAAGHVLCSGNINEIFEFIEKREIYFGEEIKFSFSMLDFTDREESEEILDLIKKKFRQEKLKAMYRELRGSIKTQSGDEFVGSPSKLKSHLTYFLFKDEEYNFGIIKEVSDVKQAEKRDMGKPVRRESQAISPRLSKILVNLSQVNPEQILLDPFCGVGGIMQEALIQGISSIGIDSDKSAIDSSKKNLDWLKKEYQLKTEFSLINQDSAKARISHADGIATEPLLGDLLRSKADVKEADYFIQEFEDLIVKVLNNLKPAIRSAGLIAFTSPFFRIGKKYFSIDLDYVCKSTGLFPKKLSLGQKKLEFPIKEFRDDQFVSREIFVLQNPK